MQARFGMSCGPTKAQFEAAHAAEMAPPKNPPRLISKGDAPPGENSRSKPPPLISFSCFQPAVPFVLPQGDRAKILKSRERGHGI
jgi:hypothetical protein